MGRAESASHVDGHRHGQCQRLVGSAFRSHFTLERISKGPQAKASHSPLTSTLDTQLTHHPLSQTLSAPVSTFFTPPTPSAETPKSGSIASEALPCGTL